MAVVSCLRWSEPLKQSSKTILYIPQLGNETENAVILFLHRSACRKVVRPRSLYNQSLTTLIVNQQLDYTQSNEYHMTDGLYSKQWMPHDSWIILKAVNTTWQLDYTQRSEYHMTAGLYSKQWKSHDSWIILKVVKTTWHTAVDCGMCKQGYSWEGRVLFHAYYLFCSE